MIRHPHLDQIYKKIIDKMFPFEFEPNNSTKYQNYLKIESFISDYNSGKLNQNIPIKINSVNVIRIGRSHSGITLVFNPINDNEKKIISELQNYVSNINSSLFSVKIININEYYELLDPYSIDKIQGMEYNNSNYKLTKQDTDEIELMLEKEGGPYSLIEYLLHGINSNNMDYIISVLYYIPEIRSIKRSAIDKILFSYRIRINWDLIENKKI